MDMSALFLGTSGSTPSARRGLPGLFIHRGGDRLLFDCGEGTQRQLIRSVGLVDLDAIFITHFHADHWLGLPGMLKTFDLRGRERSLTVYGPPGLGELLGSFRQVYGKVSYPLSLQELEPSEAVRRNDYEITPFAVRHRGTAYGYAVVEDSRPGRFNPEKAAALGIQPGPAFRRLQMGESVDGVAPEQVVGESREGRKVVYSGDTSPCDSLRMAAYQANLLICEATFTEEERERAIQTGHSTAAQAAELAAEVEVQMLALTHLSARYPGRAILDEARLIFPQSVVARDFDTVEIPLPEKGEPYRYAWSERPSTDST